jgi:hypothetical protein
MAGGGTQFVHELNSPTFVDHPTDGTALLFNEVLRPTPQAIDVLAPGRLVVQAPDGKYRTYNFAALTGEVFGGSETGPQPYCNFPYRLFVQVRRILDDDGVNEITGGTAMDVGTDITLENLVLLH